MKLIWLLVLATLACRLMTGHWPWHLLGFAGRGGTNPTQQKARALLGVSRNAAHAEIIEAHRRLIAQVHPDRGGTNEQVHEANAARDLLLAALHDQR